MLDLDKKYKIYFLKYSNGVETMVYTKHKSFIERFKKHLSENLSIQYFKIAETDDLTLAELKYQAEPLPI
ncbi:MAG: hypothetical protein ACOCV1_06565 [Bacillota bacterium]